MDVTVRRPRDLTAAVATTIVGQREVVDGLVLALIAEGHLLLEGPPGVAKTLACRALAAAVDGTFGRIQFTPDLLPSDIVGTRIFDQKDGDFRTALGPVFANVVLADEINRAPAKVQSALLEVMQERHATIGTRTHAVPQPFAVLATMNPYDAEGTYALPLAAVDRFLAKLVVDHPSRDEERTILDRFGGAEPPLATGVATLADVAAWRDEARSLHVDDRVRDYAIDLVRATRGARYVAHGASPRAALALVALARARALLDERRFVTPDDVRALAPSVLRHRLAFDWHLAADDADAESVVHEIVRGVPAP